MPVSGARGRRWLRLSRFVHDGIRAMVMDMRGQKNFARLERILRATIGLCALLLFLAGPSAVAQNGSAPRQDAMTVGVPRVGAAAIQRTTSEMMDEQAVAGASMAPVWRMMRREPELPDRQNLPQDPDAAPVSRTPVREFSSDASV